MVNSRFRIYLIDGQVREAQYAPLRSLLDADYIVEDQLDQVLSTRDRVDLALVNDEYASKNKQAIFELKKRQIPTLHLMDGILEWRNTWENPRSLDPARGLPFLQPSYADKIACLGCGQARILESWGNAGKCEVIGLPRADHFTDPPPRDPHSPDTFRLLAMTAMTPGFTEEQVRTTEASLRDLKSAVDEFNAQAVCKIELTWRIEKRLAETLGVESSLIGADSGDLATALGSTHGVLSTPSTAMLEAMRFRVPVAMLDYHNLPHYVPAAWRITHRSQFARCLNEMQSPPKPKLLYQEFVLQDQLNGREKATPRLVTLIEKMIEVSKSLQDRDEPVEFPDRLLAPDTRGDVGSPVAFDIRDLYPSHIDYGSRDLISAQTELQNLKILYAKKCKEAESWAAKAKLHGANYQRLAQAFPIKQILFLRRRLLGIDDPPPQDDRS